MKGRRDTFFRKFTNVGFDDTEPTEIKRKPNVVRKIFLGDNNVDGSLSEHNIHVTKLRKPTIEEWNIMAPENITAGSSPSRDIQIHTDNQIETETVNGQDEHISQQNNQIHVKKFVASSTHLPFSPPIDQVQVGTFKSQDEQLQTSLSQTDVEASTSYVSDKYQLHPLQSRHTNHLQPGQSSSSSSPSSDCENKDIDTDKENSLKLLKEFESYSQEIQMENFSKESQIHETDVIVVEIEQEGDMSQNDENNDEASTSFVPEKYELHPLQSRHKNHLQAGQSASSSAPSSECEKKEIDIDKEKSLKRLEEIERCIQEIQMEDFSKESQIHETDVIAVDIEPEGGMSQNNDENEVTKTKKKLKREKIYKHIDFLSDSEDFFCSSGSSWKGSSESVEISADNNSNRNADKNKKRRKLTKKKSLKETKNTEKRPSAKRKVADKDENEEPRKKVKKVNNAKVRSEQRNKGHSYITKTGKTIQEKMVQDNPCTPGNCHYKCYDISFDKRKAVFKHFWSLNKEKQKDWLVGNSKKEVVKRQREKNENSRRKWTFTYYVNEGEGKREVCLRFLLCTLNINQKTVYNIISNAAYGSAKEDCRGKHVPANKTSQKDLEATKNYITTLPYLPSHYCRKNSKRFYLPQEFRSLANLYKIYKETQIREGNSFVGEKVFQNIFREYNIGFHIPRKDKCAKCLRFGNEDESNEKLIHLKDKQDTYDRFIVHQNIEDTNILCVSFDLQKVLNTPHGQSMLLYYSRKITVYNLCFYESRTREAYCYHWDETEGKRGANEICTILERYIKTVDDRESVKHLLLYCDSCPGQNKNKIVLACIHTCLQKCVNISSIQINYLLPGHTYMPVDSVHSVIERSVTNTIIWAPSQWGTVFSLARKNPKPYHVNKLTHTDFQGWDAVGDRYFKGNLIGKISKVRIATFKRSDPDKATIKYTMAVDVAEAEEITVNGKNKSILKGIYKTRLPISKKKYDDLWKLCITKVIPEEYHDEYKNMPCSSNLQDMLPDTDEEDNITED